MMTLNNKLNIVNYAVGILTEYSDNQQLIESLKDLKINRLKEEISLLPQKLTDLDQFKKPLFDDSLIGDSFYNPNSDYYYDEDHSNSTKNISWHLWNRFNSTAWKVISRITGLDLSKVSSEFYNSSPDKGIEADELFDSKLLESFIYLANDSLYSSDDEALSIPKGHWTTHDVVHLNTGIPIKTVSSGFRKFRTPPAGAFSVIRRHIENRVFEYCLIPDCLGRSTIS